jgi:hypothetical protein
MTTKTKGKTETAEMPAISVDSSSMTVTTREVVEEGTPIETWAESIVREQRSITRDEVLAHLGDLEARRKEVARSRAGSRSGARCLSLSPRTRE